MINCGGIISRFVSHRHPGAPELDVPGAEIQCRVEYVKEDPEWERARKAAIRHAQALRESIPALLVKWTATRAEAFVYPRHLDADLRAKEIDPHCHAKTAVTPDQAEENRQTRDEIMGISETGNRKPESNLRVESASSTGAVKQADTLVKDAFRETKSDAPRPQNFSQQDGAAVARLAHNQKVVGSNPTPATLTRRKDEGGHSTGSGPAGRRKAQSARLAALREAHERTAPAGRFWYQEGQMA